VNMSTWFPNLPRETRCECLKLVRTPMYVASTLLFPLIFYVFFGLLMGSSMSVGSLPVARYILANLRRLRRGGGDSVRIRRDPGGRARAWAGWSSNRPAHAARSLSGGQGNRLPAARRGRDGPAVPAGRPPVAACGCQRLNLVSAWVGQPGSGRIAVLCAGPGLSATSPGPARRRPRQYHLSAARWTCVPGSGFRSISMPARHPAGGDGVAGLSPGADGLRVLNGPARGTLGGHVGALVGFTLLFPAAWPGLDTAANQERIYG